MKTPSPTHQLKTYLSSKGLKSTKQRDTIVKIFFNLKDHVDIETLYKKVKEKDSNIGYATVYRTIKILKDSGVISERHFGTRHAVYEPHSPQEHHDHLICIKCHEIVEFENDLIEMLQDTIAKKFKYKLVKHKHELYGYCSRC